jgi:hypothetical protein
MKSSKGLEKSKLYAQLFDVLDKKLSEGFKKPIILIPFYGDEKDIPQPNDGHVRWFAVPKSPESKGLPVKG